MKKHSKIALSLTIAFCLSFALIQVPRTEASSPTIKISTHYYGKGKHIAYPAVSGMANASAQKKINQAFYNKAKSNYEYAGRLERQSIRDKANDPANADSGMYDYSLDSTYKWVYKDSNYLSFIYDTYVYTGGAHGLNSIDTFNFNTGKGNRFFIKDMLKTSSQFKQVQNYAYKSMKGKEPYKHFVQKASDVPVNKDSQFIFYNNGIALVFQRYDVTSYSGGNPIVYIPKSIYR
ncbi:DUF4163 domain-containing protein [Bacillus sp. 1P06AnD]|uniref:DUF4163 domain-containing protein n=1 Tax=Bacillus sp. 1P06AnD TaxID=3132208 RepID=UPI00399F7F8B